MFSIQLQRFKNGVLQHTQIVQSGLESYGMADFACYLIANKAQKTGDWQGYHLVYSVIESF